MRARGRRRLWSYLGLALEGPAPLSPALQAELAEASRESALPWKVDLVDRTLVSESFGGIIEAARRELPDAG